MKIQTYTPQPMRRMPAGTSSLEPQSPPPDPPEDPDKLITAGLRYGAVAGAGVAVAIGCARGFNIATLSVVPLGALAGLFLGVGMQLIEDS